MAPEGPIDLIRLEGAGNTVTVRITGRTAGSDPAGPGALTGEILVESAFVRGSLATRVLPGDLTEWQEALDALDTGEDVGWREDSEEAGMSIEPGPDGTSAHVTVADRSDSLTTVTVPVALSDAWFDDAYHRLDEVLRAWPLDAA